MNRTSDKQLLRLEISRRLEGYSEEDITRRSSQAVARLINYLESTTLQFSSIFSFFSMRREIRTIELHSWAMKNKIPIALPRIIKNSSDMTFHIIDPFDREQLERHPFGFYQPKESLMSAQTESALILVPGMAFNTRHERMGRGGGFYDRLLSRSDRTALSIGFCFEEQIVTEIPTESHDRLVELVVTQEHIYS